MLKDLKRRALQYGFDRYYAGRIPEFFPNQVVELDYPVDPVPRYVPPAGAHPGLWRWFDNGRAACAQTLRTVADLRDRIESIASDTSDPLVPSWNQKWFTALDAMALYAIVTSRRPRKIVEIGSGNSTKFAAQAIRDAGLGTALTSIDPHPRAEIDDLCDEVIRAPLERVDQQIFLELRRGDILFLDSSHRVFTNSDVTTFFLEILPVLAPGVLLHVHDVFLPWDYPAQWGRRYYSEQYLLGCWLLSGPERLRLLLSNAFVSWDEELRRLAIDLFCGSHLASMVAPGYRYGRLQGVVGTSFWSEVASSSNLVSSS